MNVERLRWDKHQSDRSHAQLYPTLPLLDGLVTCEGGIWAPSRSLSEPMSEVQRTSTGWTLDLQEGVVGGCENEERARHSMRGSQLAGWWTKRRAANTATCLPFAKYDESALNGNEVYQTNLLRWSPPVCDIVIMIVAVRVMLRQHQCCSVVVRRHRVETVEW